MNSFLKAFLNFLFPPYCPVCRAEIAEQGDWCPVCLAKTAAVRRLPVFASDDLHVVWALSFYRGGMKKLIQQLKYQKKKNASAYIHTFLRFTAPEKILTVPDAVVPVPLYAAKEKKRGFNQTTEIFRPWARQMQYSWQEFLVRQQETRPQYELDRQERRQNMKGAFALTEHMTGQVKDKRILLVDDIFTTGATMEACAKVLSKAGAREVNGLVLASDAG